MILLKLHGCAVPRAGAIGARWSSVLAPRRHLQALPPRPARTRFAPSPTGYLHLGSLRTALYNYLLAKATGGQFLLRIEDTDRARTVADAEDRLCNGLRWAGLQWDEGPYVGGPFGPYRQSERGSIYKEHADVILETGRAYRCFCSPQRLNELAEARSRLGLPTDYDRACEGLTKKESDERASSGQHHVIRLKMSPTSPIWHDLVHGKVGNKKAAERNIQEYQGFEDPILVKSDGMPTYHFANVVDDHLMRITHVVRAVEWMPSTPKHLAIYEAFGWEPPAFAHVGLLQSEAGQKLSKRNFDADLQSYIDKGFFPEALVNYVALLGWSHNKKTDVMPLQELIENFDLKFTKGNTIVKLTKLHFLQSQYAQKYANEDSPELDSVTAQLATAASGRAEKGIPLDKSLLQERVRALLKSDGKNFVTIKEFLDRNIYFFEEPVLQPPLKEIRAIRSSYGNKIYDTLNGIPASSWEEAGLKSALEDLTTTAIEQETTEGEEKDSASRKKAASTNLSRYLRWALLGGNSGPPMVSTMVILGREKTLARLATAEQP